MMGEWGDRHGWEKLSLPLEAVEHQTKTTPLYWNGNIP